jgi:hypothetical protein
MTDQLSMTRDELDVLIGEVAIRAPQILPVLRKVRDGAIGYLELRSPARNQFDLLFRAAA